MTRNKRRWVVFSSAIAVLVLVTAIVLTVGSPELEEDAETRRPPQERAVSVEAVTPQSYAAKIRAVATVTPRWLTTLRAQVGGELVRLSERCQPGTTVKAGETLAVIDPTAWTAHLKEAENRLAAADLELLRQQQEAEEAKRNWRESGLAGAPDSPLVLRQPQTDAAQMERDAAHAARDWAQKRMQQTRVRAPFAGVITSRHVSRDEAVMAGDAIAEIYASDVFEVAVPLSENQWQLLPPSVVGTRARLIAANRHGTWPATVTRLGAQIDTQSRTRTLYLEIRQPLAQDPPLLPGVFVEVEIPGRTYDQLLRVPEGALTRNGEIWFVDDEQLARFAAFPVFTDVGHVFVDPPDSRPHWHVVVHPLQSYMVGQRVLPVEERPTATIAAEGN